MSRRPRLGIEDVPDTDRPILDSGYKHILRIFRDKQTKVMRLEAVVMEGNMKKCENGAYPGSSFACSHSSSTPIWTAFITHCITSPTWCEAQPNSSRVHLGELQRHIFSSEYRPPAAGNFLDFALASDAEEFCEFIHDIGDRIRRGESPK